MRKITTYLDAKGTSKNTCLLSEQLFQAINTNYTRKRLYERVKLFSVQRKIGDFYKDFYIQKIEKLSYHCKNYKILGKHHVIDIIHEAFEYTTGDISTWSDYSEQLSFEPDCQLQNE